ncbi:MAG: lipopolysaccharide biosynthesis protein [bacterium]|nr:lipopolysaccharide biosynthesis protein [bacterium]
MNGQPEKTGLSPRNQLEDKAFSGGLWVVFSSTATKILSLVQSVVVARLLFPEDLGLMAMASVAVLTFHTVSQPGIEAAIIQRKVLDERVADTAWTISIVRGFFLALLLWILAPWIAAFFRDARLEDMVRALSLALCIDGFANPWMITFRKELDFKRQTSFTMLVQSASVVATLISVLVLRNVWALVIGRLVGALVRTISSYFFIHRRPRLRFHRDTARELFQYGRHVMGLGTLSFLHTQGDDAFIGRVLGKDPLGLYSLSYSLSNFIGTTLSQILSRITFPLFSKLQENKEDMEIIYHRLAKLTSLVAIPFTGGMILMAPAMIQTLYGERWLEAVPAFRILCLFGLIRALTSTMGSLLMSLGHPNRVEKIVGIQLLLMILTIYPLGITWGIVGVSFCVTFANGFGLILLLRDIRKYAGFTEKVWLSAQRVPVLGTIGATLIVYLASLLVSPASLPALALLGLIGLVAYLGCVCLDPATLSQLKTAFSYAKQRILARSENVYSDPGQHS